MTEQEDYRLLLSDLIKKQMVMLGPNLVLSKAKQVSGIQVADDGEVISISGDPQTALQQLANFFMELSGNIAKTTLNALLEKYPALKKQVTD